MGVIEFVVKFIVAVILMAVILSLIEMGKEWQRRNKGK